MMVKSSLTLFLVGFVLLLGATNSTAVTEDDEEFHVVIRAVHSSASDQKVIDCSVHNAAVNAEIQKAFDNFVIPHRKLSSAIDKTEKGQDQRELGKLPDYDYSFCSKLCEDCVKGWCFFASGGICNDRRRRAVRGRTLVSSASTNLSCDQRTMLVRMELMNYGVSLPADDMCRTYFVEGDFNVECLYVD